MVRLTIYLLQVLDLALVIWSQQTFAPIIPTFPPPPTVNAAITVMFSETTYSVNENAGPAQPVLVLSNPSSMTITVQVINTGGSATGGGVDYGSGPYTVTFPAGITMVLFDIPINDDMIFEGNENFTLTIVPTSLPPTGVTVGSPDQATVTIVDNDPFTVMFNQSTYSVDKNAGPVQPVLVLSNPSSMAFDVTVTNTDGSAFGGGVDYGSGPYTVTFPAGVISVPFDIPINDDMISEANEDFTLTIDPSSLPTGGTVGSPGSAVVTIIDNDPITVMFSNTTYSVNENAGPAQPVLVLSNPSSMTFDITVTNTDVSATGGGVDYGSGPYTVTFPAGVTSVPFDVSITDDMICEDNEDFIHTIDPSSLPTGGTVGSLGQTAVTIVDDDPITVMFNETIYCVDENAGPAQPVLVLSNPSSTQFIVEVTNTDRSATGGGVDYGSGPYTVTFPAGVTSASFDIPINNDMISEGDEDFTLTIDPSSLPPTCVSVGSPDQATVTTKDDDDQTNEGNEFYVGFFRNRFGRVDEPEVIPPALWVTTKECTPVNFQVFTFFGLLASVVATPGESTYVDIPLGFVVFNSTEDNDMDTRFKGIRIKAEDDRRIVVFGQHEEVASNDAYLGLPVISRPPGTSYEYIAASIFGDSGTASQVKDSVALIIGTENDTEIILEPSVVIRHPFAPAATGGQFIPGVSVQFRTVTIQKFQTFYLQVRGGDISGTRIIANKPISVFSGHECANVPLAGVTCDIVIEQLQPIDTWGTEVVTVPLRTRSGDVLKVFASQNSTTVNVTYTNISNGMVTSDSFTLGRNGFRELGGTSLIVTGAISDFALIQSNNPIAVFQFSRSWTTDNNLISDPFMLSVPSCEQYRDSYAVATAPFDPSIGGTVTGRVAYVNYTNIAVPAEYFNASLITVNNNSVDASEFKPIRRADNSIWGYGAQLLLDEGAQVISHSDPNAALSVTLYGFSNQMSWGYIGGTGLAPVANTTDIPIIAGGRCIPQPEVIPNTDVTVMIGSSAYIVDEYDLTITCNVITGTPPINISWYRNGVVDSSSLGSKSTITIPNVDINKDNGVVYTCRAENDEGYDEQLTIVNIFTPLCSHELCRSRNNILCIIPDSMCLCKPQMGYCSAAYYSTETRSLPERCTRCRIPTDLDCLRTWSQCVKKQDEGAHGRTRRRMRTAANFKMYRHPC